MIGASWFRAYHSRVITRRRSIVDELVTSGLVTECSAAAHESVFDIQAVRADHFRLVQGPPISVSGDWTDLNPMAELPELHGTSHVTFHRSGFMVLRLTLDDVPADVTTPAGAANLAALERQLWIPTDRLVWRIGGHEVRGNVRHCLNLLFLMLHEAAHGRPADGAELAELAREGPTGCQAVHDLARRGEISHPYPVSLGTHIEIVDAGLAAERDQAREVVAAVGRASEGRLAASALRNVGGDVLVDPWYVGEAQSFLFLGAGARGESGTVSADHTRLLEFLSLRRGVLRSLERDTQRIILDRDSVSRRRIEEWNLLLSSTTDDYVLHDRIGLHFSLLVRHHDAPDLRSVRDLEAQVRRNIDAFRARLEWSSQSVSTVIGAIFAAVAAVIGLSSLARVVVAAALGEPAARLSETRPGVVAAIDTFLTLSAFLVAWFLVRKAARRVSMGRRW
jgi:hypothetical protein